MDAHVATSGLDVALKVDLLGWTQHITRGTQPNHRVIPLEVFLGEFIAILRGVNGYSVAFAPILKELNATLNGVVPPTHRFGEDQNSLLREGSQGKKT